MRAFRWKKIFYFLIISYSLSWFSAYLLHLSDIQYGTISANLFIALIYMPAPAIATFALQIVYREPLSDYGFTFKKISFLNLLLVPLYFIAYILLTFAVIFFAGNLLHIADFGYLDFSPSSLQIRILEVTKQDIDFRQSPLPFQPLIILLLGMVAGIFSAFTINLPFMFGEEFGWRGLLLKETQKMGFFWSNIFIGIFWGLWHLPLILEGHNYPSYPVEGIFMMVTFCIGLSFVFSYVRLKTKNIIAHCAFHGMVNATGTFTFLFFVAGNELYASIAGLAGVLALTIMAIGIVLFDREFIMNYKDLS